MPSPDPFYLSIASVSAVLLGICVSLRNNAYSTILRHQNDDIRLGDKDYETILNRSAVGAMLSGAAFGGTLVSAFLGVFEGGTNEPTGIPFLLTLGLFGTALLALFYSLFSGHFRFGVRKPNSPDRDERPELKD